MPMMDICFSQRKQKVKVRCLLDSGSQRTYISRSVFQSLGCDSSDLSHIEYDIKTYLGHQFKTLGVTMLQVGVSSDHELPIPVLIDEEFNIKLNIPDFSKAIANLKTLDCHLASSFDNESDEIIVQGLIGLDILQFITPMQRIKLMNGSAWKLPFGKAPFGNIRNFLYSHQATPIDTMWYVSSNYNTVISKYAKCPSTYVNFVLEPKQTYFDPLLEFFEESQVERNIEKMFSCASIGISEQKESISDYDITKIKQFEDSIEFRDGAYYVKLPWHDLIESVPLNHEVALSVLDRVVSKLEKQNLLKDYADVFRQQEEGITERIEVSPDEFNNYIWIPHRPVIRTETQVTTKIRPVFNCSLKTQGRLSLNEASYSGINLMGDLFKLLLQFRSNKFVIVSDIRKAFLMVKIADGVDRNRFCFFMKEGDRIICYRYNSIIFGFNVSPFILNFVIKHHAGKYPDDECTHLLKNNFYIDNLIFTGNNLANLSALYSELHNRMIQGGFTLRSWNTNSDELKQQMIEDDNFIDHGCDLEKVLGYKYSTSNDIIQLTERCIDGKVKTKRGILSEASKNFDPLGLCLLVTVRSKMLLRDLWSSKLAWDEVITQQFQNFLVKFVS